jgi:putative ABC transport system ATP-binding protein
MGQPVVLQMQGLSRTVDGIGLVDNISIEIEQGSVVAIVGPSGAGKSSLLRLLNRLDEPTTGTVYLNGEDYRTIPPRQLRHRVGMVLQAPFLFPGTVADNLRFGPAQRGEELTDRAIEDLLAQVELSGYAARSIDTLSGGEAQRVSLSRTLANAPEILLLDEPTAALDDETKRHVEELLQRILAARPLTCLMVTHDMAQARRLATHVLLMEQGRMIQFGARSEVLHVESVF